jgi:tRNA A22 N-methylase
MERTLEEQQKLFPVLEMKMTSQSLEISLADDKACLSATLPKEMLDSIFQKWQAFQSGSTQEECAFSRNYTGSWRQ